MTGTVPRRRERAVLKGAAEADDHSLSGLVLKSGGSAPGVVLAADESVGANDGLGTPAPSATGLAATCRPGPNPFRNRPQARNEHRRAARCEGLTIRQEGLEA